MNKQIPGLIIVVHDVLGTTDTEVQPKAVSVGGGFQGVPPKFLYYFINV